MTTLLITLIILIVAILCFLSGRLRPDLVALLVAITLGITGVLTSQEVFSGFSRSAVITIVAIFVLAEGLQRTGVTEKIGAFLGKLGGLQERGLMIVIMISGAFLSLFMNNIAAAAVLLPAVSGAARKSHLNPSRLLMPLAFGTILGGMATLFTTINIVVSSVLRDNGLAGYGILDFAPLGVPLVVIGITYMATLGWHLLPVQSSAEHFSAAGVEEADLTSIYRLGERLILARIPPGSDLSGKTLEQSNLRQGYHLNLVAIESNSQRVISPSPEVTLKQGDILLLEGRPEEITHTLPRAMLELMPMEIACEQELESQRFSLVEAILAPRSALIGHTLRSTHFREKYDLNVLAIWRSGQPISDKSN